MFDLKKLQKMQKDLQDNMSKAQEELASVKVEGTAGGGMVVAVVNGNQELIDIRIQKEAVDPNDIEMLQDLVIAAVNAGIEKAKETSQQRFQSIMPGGTGIPGLPF